VVIDVYDILQSKEDKATVPIYYEARLAKIDPNLDEVTESFSRPFGTRPLVAMFPALKRRAIVGCPFGTK
jgi:hypothetical protein